MGYSLSPSSSRFLSFDSFCNLRRCDVSSFSYLNQVTNFQIFRNRRICLSVSVTEKKLEASWLFPDGNAKDEYGGWAISTDQVDKKKGLPPFLLAGIGTTIAILLSVLGYRSITRKGFKLPFNIQLHALQGMLKHSEPKVSEENLVISEASPEELTSDEISETQASASVRKLERIVVPVAVDSAQREALLLLKKLKIVEDDVKADELCTRREYARWLVRANSLLERDPKHHIVPSVLLAGDVCAFDDVCIEDPDFCYIQALAEAGIVLSKLSVNNHRFSDQDGFKGNEQIDFSPDRFISRLDLIDWKAQLENSPIEGIEKKISRTKVGFMDVREIRRETSPGLFLDISAGEKSILRKVFGQLKRLQPGKPATKAQAAVTLTSGRMTEAINNELSRLEAENTSRRAMMEEIKAELLGKGEIQKFWEEKMNEEKARGFLVERDFTAAAHDLEQEKIVQDKSMALHLKEKAVLDCQRQLLSSLKEEVNEMSERFACEKANLMTEKQNLEDMLNELQANHETMLDAKSILEAEKEALQILRSWVEDEARKNQARAKVLEEVGRRWKWDDQA